MTTAGEVLIYNAQGKRLRAMSLPEVARVSLADESPSERKQGSDVDDDDDDLDSEDGEGKGETKGERERDCSGGYKGSGGRVVSVDWYDGAEGLLHPRVPTLCVALEGGTVQLSRGTDAEAGAMPIVVDAGLTIRQARGEVFQPSMAWMTLGGGGLFLFFLQSYHKRSGIRFLYSRGFFL